MTRRRLLLVLALIAAATLWILLSPALATLLIVEHPLTKADAIFVLSGSAAYKERADLAADRYARGTASRVLLSNDGGRGGWSKSEQTNLPFVELARRELIRKGVPPDAIVELPGEVTSTQNEAETLALVLRELEISSVLIVTSPYHTRRVHNTFTKVMPNTLIGIVATQPGNESPEATWWWLTRSGWRDVGLEYVKLPAYWLFY